MSNFQESAPNFTYSQRSWFLMYNKLEVFRPTNLPSEFYGSGTRGILFFNFASCELF